MIVTTDIFSGRVEMYERQKVDEDGYIVTEIWYRKYDKWAGKFVSEQDTPESKLQNEYMNQVMDQAEENRRLEQRLKQSGLLNI